MSATGEPRVGKLGIVPSAWDALPVSRPSGASLYADRGRLFVRGFNAEHGRYVDIDDEDRFFLDDSYVNRDESHPLGLGDLLILNGQFFGDDETSVCAPGRVIAVGESSSRNHDRMWCLLDGALIAPMYGEEECTIFRSLLPVVDRRLVADLALDGRPATSDEADRLLRLFGLSATP